MSMRIGVDTSGKKSRPLGLVSDHVMVFFIIKFGLCQYTTALYRVLRTHTEHSKTTILSCTRLCTGLCTRAYRAN